MLKTFTLDYAFSFIYVSKWYSQSSDRSGYNSLISKLPYIGHM